MSHQANDHYNETVKEAQEEALNEQIESLEKELKTVRDKLRVGHTLEIFLFRKIRELKGKGVPEWMREEVDYQNSFKL